MQSTPDYECLCLEVISKNEKFILTGCYHPPSGNFDKFLEHKEKSLADLNERRGHKCFTFGDFNVNLYNPFSRRSSNYLNTLFSNNFLPLISRGTHFKGINPTCIDHIICNDISLIKSSGIITYNFNHHLPTFITLDINIEKKNITFSKPRVKINEYLINGFSSDLISLSDELLGSELENAEIKFNLFYEKFRISYDKWFIQNTDNYSSHNDLRKDWITIGLAKSSDTKQTLYENWSANKTSANWNKYIDYQRIYNKLSNKVRFDYFDKSFKENQNNLKRTWRLINNILGRKRQNKLLVFPESNASHTFNSYFVNIANNLIRENYEQTDNSSNNDEFKKFLPNTNPNSIENCTFENEDVRYVISQLNNNKSTYFSPRILKLVAPKLAPLLTYLFNLCMKDG